MTILCYSGRVGSGKSYSAVAYTLIPALKAGRKIVTNLPLKMEEILKDYPKADIELFKIYDVDDTFFDLEQCPHRAGAVWIVDEAWKRWPQGQRVDLMHKAHGSFFAEHRHYVGEDGYSTEIVIVCQSLSQLSAFIRELVDTTFITSKLDKVGASNKFRVDIYSGGQVIGRPDYHQLISKEFGSYSENFWRYYQSHTKSSGIIGMESRADQRGKAFSKRTIIIGSIALLVVTIGIIKFASNFFDPSKRRAENTATNRSTSIASNPISTLGNKEVVNKKPTESLSKTWRLAGVVWSTNRDGIALLIDDRNNRERTIPVAGHCSTNRGSWWNWSCSVDGEQVTVYSGAVDSNTLL